MFSPASVDPGGSNTQYYIHKHSCHGSEADLGQMKGFISVDIRLNVN